MGRIEYDDSWHLQPSQQELDLHLALPSSSTLDPGSGAVLNEQQLTVPFGRPILDNAGATGQLKESSVLGVGGATRARLTPMPAVGRT